MPKPELLETFDNPYADRDYEIHMDCSEFTSLCPLGGIETDASELEQLKGGAPDSGRSSRQLLTEMDASSGRLQHSWRNQVSDYGGSRKDAASLRRGAQW